MAGGAIIDALCHSWPACCLHQRLSESFSSSSFQLTVETMTFPGSQFSWIYRRLPLKLWCCWPGHVWSSCHRHRSCPQQLCGHLLALVAKHQSPAWAPGRVLRAFLSVCCSLWSSGVRSCLGRQHTGSDSRRTEMWHGVARLAGHTGPQHTPGTSSWSQPAAQGTG